MLSNVLSHRVLCVPPVSTRDRCSSGTAVRPAASNRGRLARDRFSPAPPRCCTLVRKSCFYSLGGKGGERSRETGSQVKDRDPCACAQESLPGKMKARPNGRAALSVMVCVIKTSQGTVNENGRIFTVIWLSTCLQYLEGLC